MVDLQELTAYLNTLLELEKFQDFCQNGLQVVGNKKIKKIITGVTACQKLLDAAIEESADALLVHHGFFWKGEDPCVIGIKKNRLSVLLKHDLSLLAYHLPLDMHSIYGNNIQLAKILDINVVESKNPFHKFSRSDLIFLGRLQSPMSPEVFSQHINQCLNRQPLHIAGDAEMICSIAWCTGGAQDLVEEAVQLRADAYLTGEISERTVHIARETGIHLFAAGHHATERYGIKALGEHLAEHFDLQHKFIDIDNPV